MLHKTLDLLVPGHRWEDGFLADSFSTPLIKIVRNPCQLAEFRQQIDWSLISSIHLSPSTLIFCFD
jgi:hypothetical protein